MKQAKKHWAWAARQRGCCHNRRDHRITSTAPDFLRSRWHRHRAYTRAALHLLLRGYDKGEIVIPCLPRHDGQYDWA